MNEIREVDFNRIVLDVNTNSEGKLQFSDYDGLKEQVLELIEKYPSVVVSNDKDAAFMRNVRSSYNKCLSTINRVRIDTINDNKLLFESQCNEIYSLFDNIQKEIAKNIKEYEDSKKTITFEQVAEKPKKITATLKFYDASVIDKLKKFAEENKCELIIK